MVDVVVFLEKFVQAVYLFMRLLVIFLWGCVCVWCVACVCGCVFLITTRFRCVWKLTQPLLRDEDDGGCRSMFCFVALPCFAPPCTPSVKWRMNIAPLSSLGCSGINLFFPTVYEICKRMPVRPFIWVHKHLIVLGSKKKKWQLRHTTHVGFRWGHVYSVVFNNLLWFIGVFVSVLLHTCIQYLGALKTV